MLANLRHFTISSAMHGLLWTQDPEHPISLQSTATLFYLNTPSLHPLHAQVLPRAFGHLMCNYFPESRLVQVTAATGDRKTVPSEPLPTVGREIAARMLLADRNPDRALDYLDLDGSPKICEHSCRRLAPLRVTALLAAGRTDEAISAAAWTCAFDSELAALLPIRELINEARLGRFAIADKLSLAILLDVHLRRHDDAEAFQPLQFAYEDFVLSRKVERPSELKQSCDADRIRLVYFLRHVAVPSVMDVSFWLFKRSRDTLTERIAVCSTLAELDSDNEHIHRDEIKDITKILNVEDGLEDVDRSRVFVNLPKLERWAESELLEGFERYKALTRATGGAEDAGEFDKMLKDIAGGKPVQLERFADYPKDEAGQLLLDIFNTVTQKYLHDADFGLDAYLSMRIRHGSLAGHIRGPLEERGLLAARDKSTNTYHLVTSLAVDEAWRSHADWAMVERCVESFSTRLDALIDDLVKSRLQIKRDERPDGLFSADPTPLTIYYLRANIDESVSFSDFLGRVFEIEHIFLNLSLQQVRALSPVVSMIPSMTP
jgi:hypothetical protein